LLEQQSDFGHSAGAVLSTRSLRTPPKICVVARIAAAIEALRPALSLTYGPT
jgi:hypothetical protein